MTKRGKEVVATRADDLDTGTSKHFKDPAQVLAFDGGSIAVSEVTTKLARVVTLRGSTVAAQNTASEAVLAEENELPALMVFMTSYTAFVKATFGNSPTVLADFGLVQKKVRTAPTVETMAAAVAKRKATRTARGTTGPKKKLSTKGNVTGVEITPVTTSGAAASAGGTNGGTPPAHG
jgi:hypothetical protein